MGTILTVKQLDKSYGHRQVLHGVDFTVEEGHIVALVGPNGAGKSTIMKAALGLIPTNGGEITIAGQPVSITSHQALRQVGALIEYPGIYPFMTGRQHLQLFANKRDRAKNIDHIIDVLGMSKYIDAKAKAYSLGMKQKLGIAQALVNRPSLVILDEPMNGLDPQAVKDLRDTIRQLAQEGTTFLISSHILSELEKLADDVLVLNHGRIVKQSSMSELESAGGVTYVIKTVDDAAAKTALAKAGIAVEEGDGVRVQQSNATSLNSVLTTLGNAGINIQSVDQTHQDLESSFLNMVADDKKAAAPDTPTDQKEVR